MATVFRYLLVVAGRKPASPDAYESRDSDWDIGDIFLAATTTNAWFRILKIVPNPTDEASRDFHAIWTVEPVPG